MWIQEQDNHQDPQSNNRWICIAFLYYITSNLVYFCFKSRSKFCASITIKQFKLDCSIMSMIKYKVNVIKVATKTNKKLESLLKASLIRIHYTSLLCSNNLPVQMVHLTNRTRCCSKCPIFLGLHKASKPLLVHFSYLSNINHSNRFHSCFMSITQLSINYFKFLQIVLLMHPEE